MKKLIYLFSAFTLLTACGPTRNDAIQLNDALVAAQKACIQAEESFYDVCKTYESENIQKSYNEFKAIVVSSVTALEATKNIQEFEIYRNSGLKLIYAYRDLIDKEFSEYAKLYSIPDKEFTDEDQERSGKVADKINNLLGTLNDNFVMEQKIFAKQWNFTLKNDLNE